MAFGAKRRPADGIHKAAEGETISSIGALYGITAWEEKIWNAAENAQLKTARVNPNTLEPGDNVFIPELEAKQEARATDAWHEFHVVRNKRFLRLKLQDEEGQPLANKKYEIKTRGTFRGTFVQQGQTTDAQGVIQEEIPHLMTKALLTLPEESLTVKLNIGSLRPMPTQGPIKIVAGGTDVHGKMDEFGQKGDDALGQASDALGGTPLGGAASGAQDLFGKAKSAASDAYDALAPAVSAAAPLVNAVAGFLGEDALLEVEDKNIFPAAQRLDSLGFDPGHPNSSEPSAQFTAALLAFQTWAKQNGVLGAGAGGLLGGAGGALGGVGGAIVDTLASKAGLSGNLDQDTIDALKKVHGC